MKVLGPWADNPLWAPVYDWLVEHERVGGTLWQLGTGSTLGELYDAVAEVGRLPAGSRVLDIPCGGGVALRGVRPGQGLDFVAADIAPAMLERTMTAAAERGVAEQVQPLVADVHDLDLEDASFDVVASFTGLHCFPDPHAAVGEMARVLRPGGVLVGSAILNDTGRRFEGLRIAGRTAGILGPGCTTAELLTWLAESGIVRVRAEASGAFVYFRGLRA